MSWSLQLGCECGRAITVWEGSADVEFRCDCGRKIKVPPFRKPSVKFGERYDALSEDADSPEMVVPFIMGIHLLATVFLGVAFVSLASASVWATGYTLALAGQIWLVYLIIRECHPEAIVWTLLIPCFTWYFAFQRWDIAKWAFLCNLGGVTLFVTGLFALP